MCSFRIGLLGATVVLVCALFLPNSGRATELLLNGSFEDTGTLPYSCGTNCNYSQSYTGFYNTDTTTIPDWTINPNSIAGVEAGTGASPPAEDGVAFGYITQHGSLGQVPTATVVATDTYTLSGYFYDPYGQQSLTLYFGGSKVGYLIAPTGTGWVEVSGQFSGSGYAGDTIYVQVNVGSGADFDNISLTVPGGLPLPAALPLFAGGLSLFGGVGYWRKRRRNNVTALAAA
jgi:hypothetical protein